MIDDIISEDTPLSKIVHSFDYTLGFTATGSKLNARITYSNFIDDPCSLMTTGEFYTVDGYGNKSFFGHFVPTELSHISKLLEQEDMIAQEKL